ncbi:fluoride efflux transporter CrcB [Acidocella aromatica]|uniref:Fluoride-specific ion channel FluC n=1 Tax=Acidocella aromatica TaxID=1303579 RepID=A0A840VIZ9_9PROT|nr:fluoride efflux transporter CrcB [Acidocella aromatica]MBB5373155.1 CrcB protein [Acidocella aromatica]
MDDIAAYLWVALGGALGSVARYALGNAMTLALGASFPWGTLLINVLGSFVISCFGTIASAQGRFPLPLEARLFVTVGVCGGFTTFSSFSLQTVELARNGHTGRAVFYVIASVILCLLACALGVSVAQAVNAPRQG